MNFDKDRYKNQLPIPSRLNIKYREERDAYRDKEKELRALFEKDAEAAFGFAHLPERLRKLIHAKAWEDGHAFGYSEVWIQYHELVEIALEASKQ